MKLLLVGHACSPTRGSELAGTWNWAWHLSQRHQVWVITHPQERKSIAEFLAAHPNQSLQFVWVTLPHWLDPWDPKNDRRGLRLHYQMWQQAARSKAAQLHRKVGFDVVHHVSWGSLNQPSPLWRLPVPFVWGPIGGGQIAPPAFKRYFGPAWRSELLRIALIRSAPYRPSLRWASRKSALVFATNRETFSVLKKAGAASVVPFLDTGLRDDFLVQDPCPRRRNSPFTLLWVGKLELRKCLPLALEALAHTSDLTVKLLVAGDGDMREEWQNLAGSLGVAGRVSFLGKVPYLKMPGLYRSADALIFTSLRDSFGSQVLEAMASGLPIIGLDHHGVHEFVPNEAGVKVPVANPEETVSALANAIRRLASSVDEAARMGRSAWEFAATQRWERRAEVMNDFYADIVQSR